MRLVRKIQEHVQKLDEYRKIRSLQRSRIT